MSHAGALPPPWTQKRCAQEKKSSNSGSCILMGNGRPQGCNRRLSPLSKREIRRDEQQSKRDGCSKLTSARCDGSDNASVSPGRPCRRALKEYTPATLDDEENGGAPRSLAPLPSLECEALTLNSSQVVGSELGFTPLTQRSPSMPVYLSSHKGNDSACRQESPSMEHPGGDKDDNEATKGTLFGQVVTDDLLREWTGWEDLHLVLSAEFRVDAVCMTGVDTISLKMPLLHSLRLNNSRIPQIRLLGARFMNLKRLWVGSSQVQNLRGIGSCAPMLEELYASFNYVNDVTPLLDLSESLEVVDLEGNEIHDAALLHRCMPLLRKVKYLTLQGNPVVMAQSNSLFLEADERDSLHDTTYFREFIHSLMPDLQYLDDVAVSSYRSPDLGSEPSAPPPKSQQQHQEGANSDTQATRRSSTHIDPLQVSLCDEYMFLKHCIQECGFDPLNAALTEETREVYSRPQTSSAGARCRSSMSIAPQRSQRELSTSHVVPHALGASNPVGGSEAGFLVNAHITSPRPISSHSSCISSLTSGPALMGGPACLRRHRRCLPPLPLSPTSAGAGSNLGTKIPINVDVGDSDVRHKTRSGGAPLDAIATAPSASTPPSIKVLPEGGERCSPTVSPQCTETDIEALLFDEDDDEWELYKQNLMRRVHTGSLDMQRWAKYVARDAPSSSHGDQETGGLSSFSFSASTRTRSASSNLSTVQGICKSQTAIGALTKSLLASAQHQQQQMRMSLTSAGVEEFGVSNAELSCNGGKWITPVNAQEEEEWRMELARSVARARIKTARAVVNTKSLSANEALDINLAVLEASADVDAGFPAAVAH